MNSNWSRIVFTLWLVVGCCVGGCTLSADPADRGPVDVRPMLVMPAEVHVGQAFAIELSGSTIVGGDIVGYELRFDGGARVEVLRASRVTHRFDTLGTHVVGLRLIGYEEVEVEVTVLVVECGQPLGCRDGRPCPGGDTCVESRCTAVSPVCVEDADCPMGLHCDARRVCVAETGACP